jgi:hypothetical protein
LIEDFNRVFVLNQAGLDHPGTDSTVTDKGSGHTRLGDGLNVAAGRPGSIVFQNRLPYLKALTTQTFQLDTSRNEIASVLAIVHLDTGDSLDVFQILGLNQRDLTFIHAGPVARSAAVSIAFQTTANQSFNLRDSLHSRATLGSNIDSFNFALHGNELFD